MNKKEWIEVIKSASNIAHFARESATVQSAQERFAQAEVIFTILLDALENPYIK